MLELQDRVHNACGLAPGELCAHQRGPRNAGRGEVGGAANQQDGISPGRFVEIIPLLAQGAYTLPSCQEALL